MNDQPENVHQSPEGEVTTIDLTATESEQTSKTKIFELDYGFKKFVVKRLSGKTMGKHDVYLISPTNKKLRSMREIENYLILHYPDIPTDYFDLKNPLDGRTIKKVVRRPKNTAKKENLPPKIQLVKKSFQSVHSSNAIENPQMESTEPQEVNSNAALSSSLSDSQNLSEAAEPPRITEIALDHGFHKIIKERRNMGKGAKIDIFIVSPEGKKLRSYAELQEYMNSHCPHLPPNTFDLRKPKDLIVADRQKRKLENPTSRRPAKKARISRSKKDGIVIVLPKKKGALHQDRFKSLKDSSYDEIYEKMMKLTFGSVTEFYIEMEKGIKHNKKDKKICNRDDDHNNMPHDNVNSSENSQGSL